MQELYYMLTTQLEKQRLFYEEKIERMEINAQRENEDVLKRARYTNYLNNGHVRYSKGMNMCLIVNWSHFQTK